MQVGFYFDQTRCTGCSACRVACKDWNDIPAGPENWMSVRYSEKGKCPEVFVSYRVATCWHCVDPVCVPACPEGAIAKRERDGIVVVDRGACIGNEKCDAKCLKACPYEAPQFGAGKGARMGKCNFCVDRWEAGQVPDCVAACPVRALDAGPLDELEKTYGSIREVDGFRYSGRTQPAIIFRPKRPIEPDWG